MKRAYATISIKAADDAGGKRRFRGIASTPSTDRMGDIVEPKGAQFKLPIPLLWQHDARQPIGWIHAAKVTDKGIEVEGEVATIGDAGTLKDRIDEAWQMLKAQLVRGLSIGFNALESARIEGSYGYRFLKWEWLELSAVTIPANQDASITSIKTIDQRQRAALGHQLPQVDPPPGAAGSSKQAASGGLFHSTPRSKGTTVKTIADLRQVRNEKAARLAEILEVAKADSRDNTEDELSEFDTLKAEVSELDRDIRQKEVEQINAAAARPVHGKSTAEAAGSRGPTILVRKSDPDDKFKGQSYVRGVIAKALARMNDTTPGTVAQHLWGKSNPQLVQWIKANEVSGGGSGSGEWGAELVQTDGRYTGDFIEFLHGMTIYDRLPLREVPARVTIKGQDGAATGYWVGESKPIPASAADFSAVSLGPLKVAALAVISNELIRDSSPSAEMLVRDALAEASSQRVDQTFLGAGAAVANVSPAGLLNGLSAGSSAGNDADGLRQDIAALMAGFIAAKNVTGLHFVTTPSLALQIQLMRNALGQQEFAGVTLAGGTLEGMPLHTGDNVGSGDLILLKPSDIYRIGDSGLQVSISREASIEQNSAPTGATDTPVGASTAWTNMFQAESTAIKVVRSINYAKRRSGAVAYIGDADYGAAVASGS
jgi:HK97 family phage major capsid protein/HK97 family phage prohead protease